MKKTLLKKFLLVYVVTIIFSFVVLLFTSYYLIRTYLINDKIALLKNEAKIIASEYVSAYYKGTMNYLSLKNQIGSIDSYFDARIWLINKNGTVFADSRSGTATRQVIDINQINPALLEESFSEIGTLNGFFSEETISVGLPVRYNYEIQGYIFIHATLDSINYKASYIYQVGFVTFLVILVIAFVLIYVFTKQIVTPLQKMNAAANEYAEGNFDVILSTNSQDEIGQLATALNSMAYELSKLEEYRRSFIGNISHDFRSPLTSIKGYVEAILDGTIPNELAPKYLNIVLSETNRLNKLTSNLLTLTSIESQLTNLNITSFDINNTIKKILPTFEKTCLEKSLQFKLIFSGKELFVQGDLERIKQVLYNLVDNAIKFSYPNTHITIETSILSNRAYISVKDQGEGIPKDNIKYIWDRFYKSDLSRGQDKHGTGLGLSIVKEILKAHNETIRVFSTPSVGTEFIFTIQLASHS